MTTDTCKHGLPSGNCIDCRAAASRLLGGMKSAVAVRTLDIGYIWDRLAETQRASILKMARMERGWHYASVEVRYNAEDHHFDGTWLREVLRAFAKCEGTEQPVEDTFHSAGQSSIGSAHN